MRRSNVIRILPALLALALVPAAGATTTLSQGERSLLAAVNDVRAAHDLRPLRVDPRLVSAAECARLAHHGAKGPAFGENLAWGTGALASAQSMVRSWLDSPGHRANLLRPGWTRIGVGLRVGSVLGYDGATVVTADFAGG